MKILGTIKESNVFPDQTPTPEEQLGKMRQAVRIILFDKEGKIAMGYYPPREGHPIGGYNLPGGGVDDGESIIMALYREGLEEAGCQMKKVRELGMVKEFGVGKRVKHNQDSYCFVAEVDGEKGTPKFTEEEIKDKLELRWLTLEETINFFGEQSLSFAKVRSLLCLEEVKNQTADKVGI